MGWPQANATQDGTGGRTNPDGRTDIRMWIAQGGAAGNIAMTGSGIAIRDLLIQVVAMDIDVTATTGGPDDPIKVGAAGLTDLTSEFTINAANQINNTGGTATTDQVIFVLWADRSASESHVAGSGP